jgi:hypothetical protein
MNERVYERGSFAPSAALGAIPAHVRWVVATACALTFPTAFRDGRAPLGIGLAVAFAVGLLTPGPLSRWLRLVLLLPYAHALLAVAVWAQWLHHAHVPPTWPFPIAIVAASGGCLLAGHLIAGRRRRRQRARVAVTIAIVNLLALRMWLPLAVRCAVPDVTFAMPSASGWLIACVVAPPLVVALAIAALAHQRWFVAAQRTPLAVLLALLVVCALEARADLCRSAVLAYGSLTPVLLVATVVAIAMLAALAASTWRAAARARRGLAGVVRSVDDDPRIGWVAIASWLRGPQPELAPCVVSTARGELLVTDGAELVAHLPPVTARLTPGEALVVLRHGDRVTVSGDLAPAGGHPFRAVAALAGGVSLAPMCDPGDPPTDVALAIWRPCLVYLLVATGFALIG